MKNKSIFTIVSLIIFLSILAQGDESWTYLVNSNYVNSQYLDGNNLWLATYGGVVCYDIQTGEMKQWTMADGITNHMTSQIKVDRYGYVWCNCFKETGYGRYKDNWQFFGEDQGLPSNGSLALNNDGELWVGTKAGIYSFNYEEDRFELKLDVSAWRIFFDKEDNLWRILSGDGAYKYENGEWEHFNSEDGLPSDNVYHIFFDSKGNVWFCDERNGGPITKWDGQTMTTYSFKAGEDPRPQEPRDIAEDSDGNLWFACYWYELFKYDGENFTKYSKDVLYPDYPSQFIECQSVSASVDGTIWIGTVDGLLSFKEGMIKADHHRLPQDIPIRYNVTAMGIDNDNTIWIGESLGLHSYNGEEWTTYPVMSEYGQIRNFFIPDTGDVWIATYEGIRHCDPSGEWEFIDKAGDVDLKHCLSVFLDRNENLWVTTYKIGIFMFDGENWTQFKTTGVESEGPASDMIYDGVEDKSENLWFAGKGGVSMYNGETWKWFTKEDGLITDGTLLSILIDDQGYLWFGSYSGVSRFDGESKWDNFSKENAPIGDEINKIYQDSKGNIWFATGDGGASKFDGKNWTSYTTENGLPENEVIDIIEDKNHDMWLAIDSGFGWGGGITILHEQKIRYPVLNISTDKARYSAGDTITLSVVGENKGKDRHADIWLVMIDPAQNIYFALFWDSVPAPAIANIFFPAGFTMPLTRLTGFAIPNEAPPISRAGTYIFAVGLTDPGTMDFFHISSAQFEVLQ